MGRKSRGKERREGRKGEVGKGKVVSWLQGGMDALPSSITQCTSFDQ